MKTYILVVSTEKIHRQNMYGIFIDTVNFWNCNIVHLKGYGKPKEQIL